jgi:hypothetical protein
MLIANYNQGSMLGGATAVGGFVGVKAMQEQLRRIAFEAGKSTLDPAQYDGKVTLGTIIALANAAPVVGQAIHPVVGQAANVIGLIKAPIKKIPYGDTVLGIILSPWIIDEVYGAMLGIIRLIPGGGSVASSIDKAMSAVKTALGTAGAPIAAALALFKPKKAGFGAAFGDGDVIPPTFIETAGMGAASAPGGVTVTTASGAPVPPRTFVGRPAYVPLPSPPSGFPGVVRDRREWPKGKEIVSADWGKTATYDGRAPKSHLAARDLKAWDSKKHITVPFLPNVSYRNGAIAFLIFQGRDGARMGAFYDERTSNLKIKVIPKPSSSGFSLDFVSDAVGDALDAVGSAAGAAAGAVAGIAQSAWNFIAENADDVYKAIKKYGCVLVNNDIVVGITAAGAGIVATPATSAAVVAGAQAGKAACAALEIAEALYAIYKLLSMKFPKPVPLTTPTPPTPPQMAIVAVAPKNLQVLMPVTPPVVPLAKSRYPEGTIAAFDVAIGQYRIAIPVGTQLPTQLAGLGASGALGAAAPTHNEVALDLTVPPQVPVVPLKALQVQTGTLPLHKNPKFWIAIGVGVVVVGGGGYVLYRRRRRLTA